MINLFCERLYLPQSHFGIKASWVAGCNYHYTSIAFDDIVTFWLQRAGSLPYACTFAALYACARAYTQAYAQIMQHTHTHKAVTGRVEAKKLLSRWRQSKYSAVHLCQIENTNVGTHSFCALPPPTSLALILKWPWREWSLFLLTAPYISFWVGV